MLITLQFSIVETTSILESPKSTRTISLVDKTKVDYLDMSLNQSMGLSLLSDDSDVGIDLGMEEEAGKSGEVQSHGVLGEDFHPDLDIENAEALKQTCHTNPNWLADLTQNFKETVISKCSERVQNAVDTNEIIQVFIS